MNPQFLLWLTGAMAIFISGATASRAYIANNNILVLILALILYCIGNLMMVRLMREGGLGLAISASSIAQLIVVNIIDESRLWRAVYWLRLILRFFLLLVDVWLRLFLGWSLWLAK